MKKIFFSIIAISFLAASLSAQVDRSRVPEPGPAPEIRLGEYESFTLKNGLKVFVVRNNKLPQVAFNLLIDHDPVLEGDKAGYVNATGELLRRGTTTRTKEQLDEQIDFIGASLSASSSGVYASSLSRHKETLMELMADVIKNPALKQEELDKIIKQTKSGIAAGKENPEAIAANVQAVLLYGKDHPYGEIVTEETVDNIKLGDAKNFYQTYFKPNVAYLAIVGDITKKEAEKLVKKHLGDWKRGEVPSHTYPDPKQPEKTQVSLVDRPTAVQSVVNVMHPVELEPGAEDVIPARIMNEILGGGDARLFNNLREDKGYTYGAYSSLSPDELAGKFTAKASVRNVVTDSAVAEFIKELNLIRTEPVSSDELNSAKNYLSGSFARSLESPQTIASFALNIERYGLDKDYYRNYLKKVAAVKAEDVQAVAQKYVQPDKSYIMVVGNAGEVKEGLTRFGEVHMFDIYGNRQKPMETGSLSAEEVINKYLSALGERKRLEEIKNQVMEVRLNMNGMQFSNIIKRQEGKKYLNSTKMGEQEVSRVVYNNGEAKAVAQGQSMALPPDQVNTLKYEAYAIPELHYKELDFKLEVKGITKVNGKEAYQVVTESPEGQKTISYFDKETGLKLKTEMPMANLEFDVYTDKEGVMVPSKIKVISPQGSMEGEVVSVEFNAEIPEEEFEMK